MITIQALVILSIAQLDNTITLSVASALDRVLLHDVQVFSKGFRHLEPDDSCWKTSKFC